MIIAKNLSLNHTNYDLAFNYFHSKFNNKSKRYKIVDVGAGANPWAIEWLTHVIDKFTNPSDISNVINKNIKIYNVDVDDPREWQSVLNEVQINGKFDFVICTHTLEDVNNPKISCEMINKIGKAGFISMPSKYSELISFENKSNYNLPYKGYHHHRWIYQIKNNKLVGYPKMNFHDYVNFEFNYEKACSTEIAFLWENEFEYEFIAPYDMLDCKTGSNKLFDLFENDDFVL